MERDSVLQQGRNMRENLLPEDASYARPRFSKRGTPRLRPEHRGNYDPTYQPTAFTTDDTPSCQSLLLKYIPI